MPESIQLVPIGVVRSTRTVPIDDGWDAIEAYIELNSERFTEEALAGLEGFSHAEIIFHMNRVEENEITHGKRHPRNNPNWPEVGIFAHRAKLRPNRIGATVCRILRVSGLRVYLEGLDAIDGTPVLDLKPWFAEMGPRGQVFQPKWAGELMRGYWNNPEEA